MTLALFCACDQTRHRLTPYSFSSSARLSPDTQPTYGRDNGLRPLRGSSCGSRAGGVIAGSGNHTQSLLRPPSVGNTLLCTRFVHPIPPRRTHRRHTSTTPAPCRAIRLPRRPLEPRPEGRPRLGGLGATGAFSGAGWWACRPPVPRARGGQGPYHRPLAVYPVSYRLLASPPPPRIRMLGGDVTPVWAAASQATPWCGTAAGALDPPEPQ